MKTHRKKHKYRYLYTRYTHIQIHLQLPVHVVRRHVKEICFMLYQLDKTVSQVGSQLVSQSDW